MLVLWFGNYKRYFFWTELMGVLDSAKNNCIALSIVSQELLTTLRKRQVGKSSWQVSSIIATTRLAL